MVTPRRKAKKVRAQRKSGTESAFKRALAERDEALKFQAATAKILASLSGAGGDAQPVFDAIVENVLRLFGTRYAAVFLVRGDLLELAAVAGDAQFGRAHGEATKRFREAFPQPIDRGGLTGKVLRSGKVMQLVPIIGNPQASANAVKLAKAFGYNSLVVAPLVRDGRVIGAIGTNHPEAKRFDEKEIRVLRAFADQAVIAIENARLFNETKEALEQQTATAEILKVISSSPTDMQPVFDSILEHAMRLCDAGLGTVGLYDGKNYRHVAQRGGSPAYVKRLFDEPFEPGPSGTLGRMIAERRPFHVADYRELPAYRAREPRAVATVELGGARTYLAVPMIKDGQVVGGITIRRVEVRPFTQKQIDLVSTFANQALIAIENARLFNETKEALERQTATADILRVISSSPSELQPVFDAILESATRLCEAQLGVLNLYESGKARTVAHRGVSPEYAKWITDRGAFEPSGSLARLYRERTPGQTVDMMESAAYRSGDPFYVKLVEVSGARTFLVVPLLRKGEAIGNIGIYRREVRAFTEKQIALISLFADQAVIAIENVRLFKEIQEKSAQLEIANKHKSDFLANMSHELRTPLNAIIGFSEALTDKMFGEVNEKQLEYLKDIHESGKHLLSLINDILDLSKIEAGRMELDLSSFDLPAALSNAMTLIRERAQRHAIDLHLDVDERLGEFQGDERKFKQIMLNLLSNAVKFTPDGGRVDVCVKQDTDKIEIAVKDTGIGIAPEDQAAVFEEFKQVGRDKMRKAEGTGLGLALTKRFVELHGGAIHLESTPGEGSTFSFTLPLRQ